MQSNVQQKRKKITDDQAVEIHISMGAQLLAYMTPDDAFKVVENYIDKLREEYENEY